MVRAPRTVLSLAVSLAATAQAERAHAATDSEEPRVPRPVATAEVHPFRVSLTAGAMVWPFPLPAVGAEVRLADWLGISGHVGALPMTHGKESHTLWEMGASLDAYVAGRFDGGLALSLAATRWTWGDEYVDGVGPLVGYHVIADHQPGSGPGVGPDIGGLTLSVQAGVLAARAHGPEENEGFPFVPVARLAVGWSF